MESQNTIRGNKIVSMILRVFLLLVILLFLTLSLDVFGSGDPFWKVLAGFFIHNVFTIVLIGILVLAWKRENIAGFLLIGMAVFMVLFFGGPVGLMYGTWIMIGLPALVGSIFLLNYYLINPGTPKRES